MYHRINIIFITAISLLIAYICCLPWGYDSHAHHLDDTSYMNFKGVLVRDVPAKDSKLEATVIPAGTEIVYRFNDDGSVRYFALYSEEAMQGSLVSHDYMEVQLNREDLQDQSALDSNYQQYKIDKEKASEKYEKYLRYSETMFVTDRIIIAIPVGIAAWIGLFLLENKFAKPHVFTIVSGIVLILMIVLIFKFSTIFSYFCR